MGPTGVGGDHHTLGQRPWGPRAVTGGGGPETAKRHDLQKGGTQPPRERGKNF